MHIIPTQKALISKSLGFIFLMLFFIFSCSKSTSNSDSERIDQILNIKDTQPLTQTINSKLDSVRNLIGENDIPRLTKFYRLKHRYFQYNQVSLEKINGYADSAILIFDSKNSISANKNFYLEALLIKGDALYLLKKYSQAVLYYLEARSFREKNLDICFNQQIATRIGNVYYVQNQNAKAARYYKESYELENTCFANTDPLTHFYAIQGALNNAGFSYERAGMLDSAQHFYQKDLDYIGSCRKSGKIRTSSLNDAETIALDNLGSIYLKQNNLDKAEYFLLKSISTKYSGDEGVQIPPLIKLASLYTRKNDHKTADIYFTKALAILKVQPDIDLESRWNKEKAIFYFKQNQPKLAYLQQQNFILLKDSVHQEQAKLSSINIEKDFANLEQKYDLQALGKENAIKNIYLVFAIFLLMMVILIAFLLRRNTLQARQNTEVVHIQNTELQETLSKLEDANANYARIMKVMAHDLKNPLSGIIGISSLLMVEEKKSANAVKSIEIIKESAENALGMINEILNSFLFVVGKPEMKRENIDIQLVLEQCVSLLKFKASEKHQKLILSSNKSILVHASKEKLWRVFNNLIVNAIKFSAEGKTITVSITELALYVVISIVDNGIGIPKESAEKVYDIFTEAKRLGTAGEKAYGLGLSISKQIVEAHNGKIWFENNTNGGTTFFVQLPK